MKTLANKVAIVTGSSKGIGAAIAVEMAGKGATVVVNYAGNKSAAAETVAAIINAGGMAIAVQADVSKKEDVTRLFDEAIAAFGKVDILVNNAGIMLVKSLRPQLMKISTVSLIPT